MKTSNKIFISFLIFLFSGIIALYIGSKYYDGIYDKSNFADQKTLLSPFSVVVAEPGASFNLMKGKSNKIIQTYEKGTLPNYNVILILNDTLFIFPTKRKNATDKIVTDIFCNNVKSIIAKEHSDVRVLKFNADALTIAMNKSNLDLRFNIIAHLSIEAKDSEIYLEGEKLGKLVIKLDKTRLNTSIKKRTDSLSGNLMNASDLRFSMSNAVSLEADKTSNYDFYNLGN